MGSFLSDDRSVVRADGIRGMLASNAGQAYTEYLISMITWFVALGFIGASVFLGFDNIQIIFFDYYASLANYLNLPFF